jgi:hypothetical protein
MTTTSATTNRITPYLSEPKKTLPPLPATPEARQTALADAVFAAVLALQTQLTHHDPAIVQKAASVILDFEKTRLRHARPVAGTHQPSPVLEQLPELEPLPELPPLPGSAAFAASEPADEFDDEPFEETVERIRAEMQAVQGKHGGLQILTPDTAEQVARHIRGRQPQSTSHGPPPRR